MFPYIDLPSLPLPFGQKIDVFGVLSTIGVVTGAVLAARAAKKYGPGDDTPLRDVVPWAVIIGLSGGHFMHIFAYHPELVKSVPLTVLTLLGFGAAGLAIMVAPLPLKDPKWVMGVALGIGVAAYQVYSNAGLSPALALGAVGGYVAWRAGLKDYPKWTLWIAVLALYAVVAQLYLPDRFTDLMTTVKVWDGLSSMGGVLGALAGIFIFFRKEKIPLSPYLDALALGTAPGWAIARIGCFLVHDHPGWRTSFPLAVDYPVYDVHHQIAYGGPRHDLGLYDFFALAAISALIWALRPKLYGRGLLMGILAVVYSLSRFNLDFLRASDLGFVDKRYARLMPAQYIVVGIFIVGVRLLLVGVRQKPPPRPSPALTR